eukprot:CAMPEP_0194273462 /NCGR_PEP_ID=MMETSP0169-20130528/6793_1 /TAXON_ID=218684 /ORGANISM="Corethron pennatum, Strain L29A3" /LENGTH=784 /DNA_ID=CAMNT_0039016421 /DNA_START=76 /DNA_END=2430 /DNA_ORIENTATION=-
MKAPSRGNGKMGRTLVCAVSAALSFGPAAVGAAVCIDKKFTYNDKNNACKNYVAKNLTQKRCKQVLNVQKNLLMQDKCRHTCGMCDCIDDPTFFFKEETNNCAWVAKGSAAKTAKKCKKTARFKGFKNKVKDHCRIICNTCVPQTDSSVPSAGPSSSATDVPSPSLSTARSFAPSAVATWPVELMSAPSSAPSVYVTNDPLLATHRHVAHHWYPIFRRETEPVGHRWVTAENNVWPIVVGSPKNQTVTVLIPDDQTVVYSGADGIKYDKIIVKGSLTIQPVHANVVLTATTIIVERGGVLDIKTDKESPHTVAIEIEGALDATNDPQETMVGIVAWEGKLSITGNAVATKMAGLADVASAGTNVLKVDGANLGFILGGELVLPDTQTGLDIAHWSFNGYVDQTEICTIKNIESSQFGGETLITCEQALVYDHSVGSKIAYVTRSIKIFTSPSSVSRGHILHTGVGKYEVRNTRIENFGRTTTDVIDSTTIRPTGLKFGPMRKQMEVTHNGTNQIARYALHAHHSKVEAYFTGNALLYSPRDGMVAHNSRVHMIDNIIVGADGTGIFLEDSTETGPVVNNYIIGTGGGSRSGDDSRFGTELGRDMAHGGFGIWARGLLALIENNHCEGHFGLSPYAFFVHPKFVEDKPVPDIPGTPTILVGKTRHEIRRANGNNIHLQSYGGFVNNTAVATFVTGIALSYFPANANDEVGSIIEGAHIRALGSSGQGISTTHSRIFTLKDVTIEGMVEGNTITGIWCGSCNNCNLVTPNTTLIFENLKVDRGGNC